MTPKGRKLELKERKLISKDDAPRMAASLMRVFCNMGGFHPAQRTTLGFGVFMGQIHE